MKSNLIGTKYAKLAWFVVLFFGLQVLLHLMTIANHTFGNVHWYYRIATQMHTKGFFHVWMPYPPVFSFLLYLSTTFFRTFAAFLLFWKVLNVSLVLAIALVIHRIVARQSKEIALLAALGYVLINATWTSAVTVGFYFDQFDYIPILLMMTALFTLMNKQHARSAVLSGVGAMTKLFPVVVLLIALFTFPWSFCMLLFTQIHTGPVFLPDTSCSSACFCTRFSGESRKPSLKHRQGRA